MKSVRLGNPSLEFDWLPNSIRKGLETPRIFLSEDNDLYGGRYIRRTPDRCVVHELDIDLREGPVIEICASKNAACIAHEYRHHWQIESGFLFGHSVWTMAGQSYEDSIVSFFKSYWWEMDALQFELKHAPNDVNLLWKQLIMDSRK